MGILNAQISLIFVNNQGKLVPIGALKMVCVQGVFVIACLDFMDKTARKLAVHQGSIMIKQVEFVS